MLRKKKISANIRAGLIPFVRVSTFFQKNTEQVSAFFASICCFVMAKRYKSQNQSASSGYKIQEKKGEKNGHTIGSARVFLFFTRKKVGAIDNQ